MAVERAAAVASSPKPPIAGSTNATTPGVAAGDAASQLPAPPSSSPDKTNNGPMFTCQICFDDLRTDACRELGECVHKYCVGCMRSYLRVIANESKKFPIPCPDPSCDEHLDPQLCIMALEGKDAEMLSRLVIEKTHCKSMNYCANASCATPFDFEAPPHDAPDEAWCIECPLCKSSTCVRCKSFWHAGATCAEAKANAEGAEELKELAKKENWKACPKCGEVIERISGCNYMRCRCGARFCYACGTPYRNSARNNRNPHGTPGCDCGLIVPRRPGDIGARVRMINQRFIERRNVARNRRNIERVQAMRGRRMALEEALHREHARPQFAARRLPNGLLQPQQREGPQPNPELPAPPPPIPPPLGLVDPDLVALLGNPPPPNRGRYSHTASSVRPGPNDIYWFPALRQMFPEEEARQRNLMRQPFPPSAAAEAPQPPQPPRAPAPAIRHGPTAQGPQPNRMTLGQRLSNRPGRVRFSPRIRSPLQHYSEEMARLRRLSEGVRVQPDRAPLVLPANGRPHLVQQFANDIPEEVFNGLRAVRNNENRRRSAPIRREVIDVDQPRSPPRPVRRVIPSPHRTPRTPQRSSSNAQGSRRILPMRRNRQDDPSMTLSDWLARRRGSVGFGPEVDDSGPARPRRRRRGEGPNRSFPPGSNAQPPRVAVPEQRARVNERMAVIDVDEVEAIFEAPKKAERFRTNNQEDSIAPVIPPEIMERDARIQRNENENMLSFHRLPDLAPGMEPEQVFVQQMSQQQQSRNRLQGWLDEVVNARQNLLDQMRVAQEQAPARENQENQSPNQPRVDEADGGGGVGGGDAENDPMNGLQEAFPLDVVVEVLSD